MYKARLFRVFFILVGLITCGLLASDERLRAQPVDKMDARKILGEMQKAYEKVKTITAQLKMVTISLIFDEKSEREGRIYLKKPYEFRWDIEKPYQRRFYLNKERAIEFLPDKIEGGLAKIYNLSGQDEKIGENSSRIVALAILESPEKLKEYYEITLIGKVADEKGKKEYYKLELVPKDDSVETDYNRMIFYVNLKNWIPEKMEAYEGEEAEHHFYFNKIKLNKKIKDSIFRFKRTKDMTIDEYPKKEK